MQGDSQRSPLEFTGNPNKILKVKTFKHTRFNGDFRIQLLGQEPIQIRIIQHVKGNTDLDFSPYIMHVIFFIGTTGGRQATGSAADGLTKSAMLAIASVILVR